MKTQLVNRYAVNMHGVLSCYDRIVISGTLPEACYAGRMGRFLYRKACAFLTTHSFPSRYASARMHKRSAARPTSEAIRASARMTTFTSSTRNAL